MTISATTKPAIGTAVMAYSHTSGQRSEWAHRGIVTGMMPGSDEMVLVWFPHLGAPATRGSVQAVLPHEIEAEPVSLGDCPPSWVVKTYRTAKRTALDSEELGMAAGLQVEKAAKRFITEAREQGRRL